MKNIRIAIGADHAAVVMKDLLVAELRQAGARVEDLGTNTSESVDYPDYASLVTARVVSGGVDRGILLCGTGIGMCIAANKVAGIRAALCHDVTTARLARLHNDSNVLCMGGRILGQVVVSDIVRTWLSTQFEGGRHQGRIDKIEALESASAKAANAAKETRK